MVSLQSIQSFFHSGVSWGNLIFLQSLLDKEFVRQKEEVGLLVIQK